MPNLHLIRQTVDGLSAEAPLDLVILPEIFDGRPHSNDGTDSRRFLQTLARTCDVHVIGGSCLITDSTGRHSNSCFVVHRSGEEVGRYDKRVMFATETECGTPGSGSGVFRLDSFRVGVLICADMWRPDLARELLGRIDILAVPTKTSVSSDTHVDYARANWHAMALTRAMENGFVVAVADWPAGRHESCRAAGGDQTQPMHYTSGATCIIDPSHRPRMERIQRVMEDGKPGVLRARIDPPALEAYRTYRKSIGLLPDAAD